MTKKGFLFAGALLMAGCGAIPGPMATAQSFEPTLNRSYLPNRAPIGQCTGIKCRIDLKVHDPKGACEPRPADPINELVQIKVLRPPPQKVQIVWLLLDSPDYLFLDKNNDGIKFKNGANRFEQCKIISNGREYQCIDKMEEKGTIYNYTIQATHVGSNKKCVWDPGIVNDW